MDSLPASRSLHPTQAAKSLRSQSSVRQKLLLSAVSRTSSNALSSSVRDFKKLTAENSYTQKPLHTNPEPFSSFSGSSSNFNRKAGLQITDSTHHSISQSTDHEPVEQSLEQATQNYTVKLLLRLRDLRSNSPNALAFASCFLGLMSCIDPSLHTYSRKISPAFLWSKFVEYLSNPGHVTKMIRDLSPAIKRTEFRSTEISHLVKQLQNCEKIQKDYFQGLNQLHKILKLAVRIVESKKDPINQKFRIEPKIRPLTSKSVRRTTPKPPKELSLRQLEWAQQRNRKKALQQKSQKTFIQQTQLAQKQKQNFQILAKQKKATQQAEIRSQKQEQLLELRRIKALNESLAKKRLQDDYARNRLKSALAHGSREVEKSLLRDTCKTIISGNTEESYFRNIMRNQFTKHFAH